MFYLVIFGVIVYYAYKWFNPLNKPTEKAAAVALSSVLAACFTLVIAVVINVSAEKLGISKIVKTEYTVTSLKVKSSTSVTATYNGKTETFSADKFRLSRGKTFVEVITQGPGNILFPRLGSDHYTVLHVNPSEK